MSNKLDPQNCWEFWNCIDDVKQVCPLYITDSGRHCWNIVGFTHKHPECPKVKNKFDNCEDCDWYKKQKPAK